MRSKFLMLVVVVLSVDNAWAGTVYKCRSPQGDLVYQETPCNQDAQPVKSWSAISNGTSVSQQADDGALASDENCTLVIPQNGNGHYFVDGSVNDKPLNFVVDSGASSVVLPRAEAMAAGVYCRDQILMRTVNGTASGCAGIAAKLRFGPFQIRDVPVVIAPNLTQPLLGMNVLQKFRIEQDGGEMRFFSRSRR